MGAHNQNPEDTLEASPTNLHPAAGWEVEEGKLVPERERRGTPPTATPASSEPAAGEEECPPEASAGGAAPDTGAPGTGKKRRCPPVNPE